MPKQQEYWCTSCTQFVKKKPNCAFADRQIWRELFLCFFSLLITDSRVHDHKLGARICQTRDGRMCSKNLLFEVVYCTNKMCQTNYATTVLQDKVLHRKRAILTFAKSRQNRQNLTKYAVHDSLNSSLTHLLLF